MNAFAGSTAYAGGPGGGGMDLSGIGSDLGGFLGGLFTDSAKPYEDAMDQYQQWTDKAQNVQNPYLQAGQGAIPNYQDWLQGQKDPSGFINHLMGQYQESPWAKYQQEQGMRAAQNMGSASGLTGSTPLMQFAQQQAQGISSQDMQNWLSHVLGINTQYGQGQGNLMAGGQNAANALTNLYSDTGKNMAEASYGKAAGENADTANMWGGLINLGVDAASLL